MNSPLADDEGVDEAVVDGAQLCLGDCRRRHRRGLRRWTDEPGDDGEGRDER